MANKKGKSRSNKPRSSIGDQNIINGNISGGVITQGRNARVSVRQSTQTGNNDLNLLFEKLYQYIESRPDDGNVDKEEVVQTVQKLEGETAKGEEANQNKLSRWITYLENMAPDIMDVIVASLGGPVTGITAVLKKIADNARK